MRASLLLRPATPLRPTVSPASKPITLITTNNSTRVNARRRAAPVGRAVPSAPFAILPLPKAACWGEQHLFSGVRPSSVAEMGGWPAALRISQKLDHAELTAPEDGRTPLNRYGQHALRASEAIHATA